MIFGAILSVFNMVPEAAAKLKNVSGNKEDVLLAFNVAIAINIVIYLWYFLLARRAAHGKSRGTLYMVLLILGIIGKITAAIMTRSIVALTSFDFIIDAFGLYFLFKVRRVEN